MRLQIVHDTRYRYGQAPSLIVQALRMWPAPAPGQEVREWRVEVDGRPLRPSCVDGFGNPVATHTIDRSVDSVRIRLRGQADTRDLQGVHGPGEDVLPPMFYLRQTALTACTGEISAFARQAAGDGSALERAHRLSAAVRDRIDYLPETTTAETTAAEAFQARRGVCQDHAHVLAAAARAAGLPARYVSGYLCPLGAEAAASHAWAEIHVGDLGWVGFDAANRQCPDERYVRVACGRDYRDAAPVRGVRLGGIAETLEVEVSIGERAASQSQSQSRSSAAGARPQSQDQSQS
jgi:transglutaminase-like putative cysteine protease